MLADILACRLLRLKKIFTDSLSHTGIFLLHNNVNNIKQYKIIVRGEKCNFWPALAFMLLPNFEGFVTLDNFHPSELYFGTLHL